MPVRLLPLGLLLLNLLLRTDLGNGTSDGAFSAIEQALCPLAPTQTKGKGIILPFFLSASRRYF